MTKMNKRFVVVAALAALMAPPMVASAAVDFSIRIAPPAPRVEVVPAARVGYVWTPGYWAWRNNGHVWIAGTYVKSRPGYVYRPPIWVQGNGGWRQVGGTWDRDHDGVPNRYDRDRDGDGIRNGPDKHPNTPRHYDRDRDNDGVRNRNDRDRDGDGIANGPDRHPNKPNRP